MLADGEWLDDAGHEAQDLKYWKPPGCALYEYNGGDVLRCLRSRRLVFVGDSTTRQLARSIANRLNGTATEEKFGDYLRIHGNISVTNDGAEVAFIWDPFLNQTDLTSVLESRPAGLIFGAGIAFARNFEEDEAAQRFKTSLDAMMKRSTAEGLLRYDSVPVMLLPVQPPDYEKLSPSRSSTISFDEISAMNQHLRDIETTPSNLVFWSHLRMTDDLADFHEENGFHVKGNIAEVRANTILNRICNANPDVDVIPHERTCCSGLYQPSRAQLIIVFVTACLALSLSLRKAIRSKSSTDLHSLDVGHLAVSGLALGSSVLIYCYVTDRLRVLETFPRLQSPSTFLILLGECLLLSLLSVQKSRTATFWPLDKSDDKLLAYQERDSRIDGQIAEWKGLGTLLILASFYANTESILWVHQLTSIAFAMYLFGFGFEQMINLYATKDFSLARAATALLRVNIVGIALSFIMGTRYFHYYLPSALTFWYLVIFFTVKAYDDYNDDQIVFFGKLIISAFITREFIKSFSLLESVYSFMHHVLMIDMEVNVWRGQIYSDMYIVFFGVGAGYLYAQWMKPSLLPFKDTSIFRRSDIVRRALTNGALVLTLAYVAYARSSTTIVDFDSWHMITSWAPVLSALILRNAHQSFRDVHSHALGILGKCSVEATVLAQHIWLGGDGRLLLKLGLLSPQPYSLAHWVEIALVTGFFIWISSLASVAADFLTTAVVRSELGSRSAALGHTEYRCSGILRKARKRTASFDDYDHDDLMEDDESDWRLNWNFVFVAAMEALQMPVRWIQGDASGLRKRLLGLMCILWFLTLVSSDLACLVVAGD